MTPDHIETLKGLIHDLQLEELEPFDPKRDLLDDLVYALRDYYSSIRDTALDVEFIDLLRGVSKDARWELFHLTDMPFDTLKDHDLADGFSKSSPEMRRQLLLKLRNYTRKPR